MTVAYLKGPDIVEVTFGTDIQLLTLSGFSIPTRTITDFAVTDNVLLLSIDPYVIAGGPNLSVSYNGSGNLESLPTFISIEAFTEPVFNRVEQEYIVTLDNDTIAGINRYYIYNANIFPAGWLIESGGEGLDSLDDQNILVDASPNSWLYGLDGEVLVGFDQTNIVVDPYT